MPSCQNFHTREFFFDNLFHLNALQQKDSLNIILKLNTPFFYTNELPSVVFQLEGCIPGIFNHRCFNDGNLPFKKEVENTEIGHLFEHMVLELMSQDLSREDKSVRLKGETIWNWKEDERGTFRIFIESGSSNYQIFVHALEQAVVILKDILETGIAKSATVPGHFPSTENLNKV